MRDVDIRRLFDQAADLNESDITPEEIKSIVDEKIKNSFKSTSNFSEGEGYEPVILSTNKQKISYLPQIMAGLSAACFIAVAAGLALYLGHNSPPALSSSTDTSASEAPPQETTVTTEDYYNYETFTLIDGTYVYYQAEDKIMDIDVSDSEPLIKKQGDRLYYKDTDITDHLTDDYKGCYLDIGEYEDSAYYVLVGGNFAGGDYGYAIIFKAPKSGAWGIAAWFSREIPAIPGNTLPEEADKPQWLVEKIDMIKNKAEDGDPDFEIDWEKRGYFEDYVKF